MVRFGMRKGVARMGATVTKSNTLFETYLPTKVLQPYIAYYSVQYGGFQSIAPLFVPDLGGSMVISVSSKGVDIRLWGPYSELTRIDCSEEGTWRRYFVEFQPGGLSRLIHPNCRELLNQKWVLSEIDVESHTAIGGIVEENLFAEGVLINALNSYFYALLERRREYFIGGRSTLDALQALRFSSSMDDLSDAVHYSTRQINRYLLALTGVSGKAYMRIKRFNRAAVYLKSGSCSVECLSNRLFYYDAAHFVHDFTQIAGISPARFRQKKSDFYNETLKTF
ncbi:helix-turn-helix domain-containing protein [Fusibacter sp. JL298sf-3]